LTGAEQYQGCLFAVINPPLRGKVGRLGTVEPMIETGMVSKGEGHNKLPDLLSNLKH